MVCLCHPPTLLTPHFNFPLVLYVYITLTNNYLGFFIYQLIILINWHRWLLVNNHISKYNSFILVLYQTTSPGKLVPTLVEVTTFPSWWRTMGLLLLKGFKDGSWRRQTGINSSIYAALVCNNLPLQMLMIPCLSSLPSWRTLQKKLFLRLRQYQNVSINHGFMTFAKMQSKSATGPLRGSNVNQPRVTWMPIALLGLRLAEISDTVRKHLGEIISSRWILKHRLNLFGIGSVKSKEKIQVTLHHLSVNDRDVTSHRDIANALADNCSYNSSSAFSTDAFASVRKKAEKQTIKFSSYNAEVYNKPLSMEELRDALRRAHDTSAGPDEIHYQLLKHLPDASLLLLLNILNQIWLSGDFPSDWKKTIVIPIPKPGKDPTNPINYRLIALTSCICKTMERMINRRLVWYLESHKLLTNVQCGFRSKRSTVDHLVRFETFCST